MNIDHLIIFANLVETLNFSLTAKKLHITQSAVSQAIKALEKQLQVNLFIRSHHSVQLTSNGKIFYDGIKPLLNSYHKAIDLTREQANREKSNFSIATTGSPYEEHFLPLLIHEFKTKNPKVKIFLEYQNHEQVNRNLINEYDDLIFTTKDDVERFKKIKFHKLLDGKFCALIPKENTLSKRRKIHIQELNGNTLILMDSHWAPPAQWKMQQEIIKICNKSNFEYVNNIIADNTMTNAGIGIAIMPDFIAYPNRKLASRVNIYESESLAYGTAYLKENLNPNIFAFNKTADSFFKNSRRK